MNERELPCMQQHAMAIELLAEKVIVVPVAVGGVADDRVEYMLQVAPDLVIAAGERRRLDERVPCRGIAPHRVRQLDGS